MSFKIRLPGKRPAAASPSQPDQVSSPKATPSEEDDMDKRQMRISRPTDMPETGSGNNTPGLATPKLRLERRTAKITPATHGSRCRSTPTSSSAHASQKKSRKLHKQEFRERAKSKSLNSLVDLQSKLSIDSIGSNAGLNIDQRPSPKIKLKRGSKTYVNHFLRLARELREVVYKYHVEDHPLILSNKSSKVVSNSPLMVGNKQLHLEYTEYLSTKAPIYARIRNWDFSNTITFLNKLSVGNLTMFMPCGRIATRKTITFILSFSVPTKKYYDKFAQDDKLTRWVRRFADPGKNGFRIDWKYECETLDLNANMPLGLEHTAAVLFDLYIQGDMRSNQELGKIDSALQSAHGKFLASQLIV